MVRLQLQAPDLQAVALSRGAHSGAAEAHVLGRPQKVRAAAMIDPTVPDTCVLTCDKPGCTVALDLFGTRSWCLEHARGLGWSIDATELVSCPACRGWEVREVRRTPGEML